MRLARLALLAVALTAHLSAAPAQDMTGLDGTWILATFDGAPPDGEITLQIDTTTGAVGGKAACNTYRTELLGTLPEFSVSEAMAMTMMACPEPLMALQESYTAALLRVTQAAVQDGTLLLTGPDTQLVFTPAP